MPQTPPLVLPKDHAYMFATESYRALSSVKPAESILSVSVGAGDAAMIWTRAGWKNITIFDNSPYAKYAHDLKFAAVKNLTLDEFVRFYGLDNKGQTSRINTDMLARLMPDLPKDTAKHMKSGASMWSWKFRDFRQYRVFESDFYKSDAGFKKAKAALRPTEFIMCDMGKLADAFSGRIFNAIYLSNAMTFYDRAPDLRPLVAMKNLLCEAGRIYLYFFPLHQYSLDNPDYEDNFMTAVADMKEFGFSTEVREFAPNPFRLEQYRKLYPPAVLKRKSTEKLVILKKETIRG